MVGRGPAVAWRACREERKNDVREGDRLGGRWNEACRSRDYAMRLQPVAEEAVLGRGLNRRCRGDAMGRVIVDDQRWIAQHVIRVVVECRECRRQRGEQRQRCNERREPVAPKRTDHRNSQRR